MKKIFLLIAGFILLSYLSWGQELMPNGKKCVIRAGEGNIYLQMEIVEQNVDNSGFDKAKFIAVSDKTEATIFFYRLDDEPWNRLVLQDFESKKIVVFPEISGSEVLLVNTFAEVEEYFYNSPVPFIRNDNRIDFGKHYLFCYPTEGTVEWEYDPQMEPFIDKFYFIEEPQ